MLCLGQAPTEYLLQLPETGPSAVVCLAFDSQENSVFSAQHVNADAGFIESGIIQ